MSILMNQEAPDNCPACGSALQREFIFRTIDRKSPLVRHLTAWCDACGRAFHVSQRLQLGIYVDEAPGVTVVRDRRQLAGIKARVAHIRGDLQLACSGN